MRNGRRTGIRLAAAAALLASACSRPGPLDYSGPTSDWREYAGTKGGSHYSPLTQVTRANVGRLALAWSHRSGDFNPGSATDASTAFQATPLVVNDTLYYCTPYMRVFALDPETGAERWMFDPVLRSRHTGGPYPLTCRGVAYWERQAPQVSRSEPKGSEDHQVGRAQRAEGERSSDTWLACTRRILYGTRDSELIALDADTGKPCEDFGAHGRVALREGIGGSVPDWEYYPTSPPLVIGDIAVIGALVADQLRTDAPSGVVRAFDVRSGRLVWAWDPVPPGWKPDPLVEGELYQRGTPNVWSILSGDPERGLVFVPTGNPSPDSYGGLRRGIDYFGSSTIALDAKTGKIVWHFQEVHHDIWDYDTPAQPQLFQHPQVGGGRPAVIQPTKVGHVFILDRETGAPLYPVEERPAPQGAAPGETPAPTQPYPTHPGPLHPSELTADDVFGFTPWDRRSCREELRRYRYDGPFTPPTLDGSIQMPATLGGMNWGGVALDPVNALMITNQSHLAIVTKLVPRAEFDAMPKDSVVYPAEAYPMKGTPYGVIRHPLFSNFGAPCNPPPWGSLTGVDLVSGKPRWRVTLGTIRDQAPFPVWAIPGFRHLGAPSFAGGLLTASAVYFIGATSDKYFRAFDAETGAQIWSTRIPYTGNGTPMSYRLRPDARQFVVIASGGNPLTGTGDALLAFALE